MSESDIVIRGARVHNLRGVDLRLPRGRLICFTGVSGSGKSSLAFDTVYAEGRRRYVESLSSYARQFLGTEEKPDVDFIGGLSPTISIQQKTAGDNPRSTVGTITQIADFLRVLFARLGTQHCPDCALPIAAQTPDQIVGRLLSLSVGRPVMLLAPVIRGQKGEHRDLLEDLRRQGFARARVDGRVLPLAEDARLDRGVRHNIEVVVDRFTIHPTSRGRIVDAVQEGLRVGDGVVIAAPDPDAVRHRLSDTRASSASATAAPAGSAPAGRSRDHAAATSPRDAGEAAEPDTDLMDAHGELVLSAKYACPKCGAGFEAPSPQLLSFNAPAGMCKSCGGLGSSTDFDPEKLFPDTSKSLDGGALAVQPVMTAALRRRFTQASSLIGFSLKAPWRDVPADKRKRFLHGSAEDAALTRSVRWRGLIPELRALYDDSPETVKKHFDRYRTEVRCRDCKGGRLNPQALAVRLPGRLPAEAGAHPAVTPPPTHGGSNGIGTSPADGARSAGSDGSPAAAESAAPERPSQPEPSSLNIAEASSLSIADSHHFFSHLVLTPLQELIGRDAVREVRTRLQFLLDVGLDYLTLDRAAPTLSGGEAQRIRLAAQVGCGLVGVTYVLDEPSIGLHPRDNTRLVATLRKLRDMGNTVIVVEHDEETMRAADLIVDFGPGPGVKGGKVVFAGDWAGLPSAEGSVTADYLTGRLKIGIPKRRPVSPEGHGGAPVQPEPIRRGRAAKTDDDGGESVAGSDPAGNGHAGGDAAVAAKPAKPAKAAMPKRAKAPRTK